MSGKDIAIVSLIVIVTLAVIASNSTVRQDFYSPTVWF